MKTAREVYEETHRELIVYTQSTVGIAIEAMERYAKQVGNDVLERAAENAQIREVPYYLGEGKSYEVDPDSITDTEIILP